VSRRRYRRRGALYLVCWADNPYQHARHYLGFAYPDDPALADAAIVAEVRAAVQTRSTNRNLTAAQAAGVARRIGQHRAGRGARILAAIIAAGNGFTVVRVWASATEAHEKALKDRNCGPKLCPRCNPGTRTALAIVPRRYRRKRKAQAMLAA
jgi:hypothetical protein